MESLSKFSKLKKFFLLFLVITFLFFSALGAGNKLYADNNITVFIDPGHGGSDPGCVHNGLNEKNVNLTVSLKLKSKLEQNGYRVVMSRTTDIYRSLDERVNMANVSGANIFLSIHGNAWYEPDANGTETYWSPSGAAGSSQFATVIQKNLVKSINRRDRGVKTADFKVIKYTKMTSALVEYVFLSNPEEAQLLKSDTFLNKIADGLFNGIKEYSLSITSDRKILMNIDYPKDGNTLSETITLRGWAVENSATVNTGITKIDVYDGPYTNKNFLGAATYGLSRPDVATYFGKENYTNSGYSLGIDTTKLTNGQHILYVYAYNPDLGWKYMTRKVNVSNGVIDNSTNIIGKASATEEQLLSLFVSRNSNQIDRAGRLAPLYIKWGDAFNIRYDIAWAMMCHETGFLQFGGIVPPDANNFCGLGATGAKDENGNYIYNSFATEELGVIAQYIHLAWYIYPDHLTSKDSNGDLYCSTKYDPRHFGTGHNYNGDSTLGTLNERWAPAPDYTNKIIQFANEIYN